MKRPRLALLLGIAIFFWLGGLFAIIFGVKPFVDWVHPAHGLINEAHYESLVAILEIDVTSGSRDAAVLGEATQYSLDCQEWGSLNDFARWRLIFRYNLGWLGEAPILYARSVKDPKHWSAIALGGNAEYYENARERVFASDAWLVSAGTSFVSDTATREHRKAFLDLLFGEHDQRHFDIDSWSRSDHVARGRIFREKAEAAKVAAWSTASRESFCRRRPDRTEVFLERIAAACGRARPDFDEVCR